MKVAFCTLGCKVNQYETQAMQEIFESNNFTVVDFEEYADVYIINTCTVTSISDRKSRQMIRKAIKQNVDAVIVAAGCYAQTAPDKVAEIENVDIVVGTSQRAKLIELVNIALKTKNKDKLVLVENIEKKIDYENIQISRYEERARGYIKIQDGCNNFCSYCKIPYARGRVRSRALKEIKDEVQRLVESGVKEIILTGIHLGSYGLDFDSIGLIDAIKVVAENQSVRRIRLGSLEPRTFTDDFVNELVKIPTICPHFHISMQSGCDETLKRMNRKYTSDEFLECVNKIRAVFDNPAITTDLIVGFPGETNDEFDLSYNFVDKVSFADMHVFKYSPREGTRAASMPNQVEDTIKEIRSHQMITIAKEKQLEYLSTMMNKTYEVLIEAVDDEARGHTENYILATIPNPRESKAGDIVRIKVIAITEDGVIGEIYE